MAKNSGRRRIVRWIVFAIGPAVVGLLWYGVSVVGMTPGKPGDHGAQVRALIESQLSVEARRSENRWREFVDLMALAHIVSRDVWSEFPDDQLGYVDYTMLLSPDWREPEGLDLRYESDTEYLEQERAEHEGILKISARALEMLVEEGTLERFDALMGSERFVRPRTDATPLFVERIGYHGSSRSHARALRTMVRLRAIEGDLDGSLRCLERLLWLGRTVGIQGTAIELLVGIAISDLAMDEVREMIELDLLPPERLSEVIQIIQRQTPAGRVDVTIKCERLMILDMLQRTYTEGENGRYVPRAFVEQFATDVDTRDKAGFFVNFGSRMFARKTAVVEQAEVFFDRLVEAAGKMPNHRDFDFSYPPPLATAGRAPFQLSILGEGYASMFTAVDKHMESVSGLVMMLAIESYRHERGALPRALEDLVPSIVESLPRGPFEGLVYRVRGDSYALYSIGENGRDEGGDGDDVGFQPGAGGEDGE